jgi:hypothetical protein
MVKWLYINTHEKLEIIQGEFSAMKSSSMYHTDLP